MINEYRRQVEVVHGIQYDGSNAQEVIDFTEGSAYISDGKFYLKHPGGFDQEIRNTDWTLSDAWGNNFVMGDIDFKIVYAPVPALSL